jgi:pimeloyl-ACP methyl ester carboxylesterase
MTGVGAFLRPDGFTPPALSAVLHETSVVAEAARHLGREVKERCGSMTLVERTPARDADPVLLVPGFLAGDGSLALLSRWLRRHGVRTYRSHMHANAGCTVEAGTLLEERLEQIADRRGSRVAVVGHSLGGMLARGLAVRRPDLVSGIVTLGSPMLAPGAHHVSLARSVQVLTLLSRAGVPGLMSFDCVAGECARTSFEEGRQPMPDGVDFTAVYSRRDGIVDWRACLDPQARPVEVRASHVGMAVDPATADAVLHSLRLAAARRRASVLEVDAGVGA